MGRSFGIYIMALLIGAFLLGCSTLLSSTSTAAPIPQPTITSVSDDSKFCQEKMQLSAPIVVRPEGAGGTDSAEYGYWATESRAVSTGAGILVTWRTGIDGQYPEPNVYMRLLDDNAQPIGEISLPFERSMIQRPAFASKEDGALLTFCGVYKGEASGARITSVLLDPYGKFISAQRRFSANQPGCGGYEKATGIWTGSRLLFAWYSQSYSVDRPVKNILFEVADADGNSLLERSLRTDGSLEPHFAYGHGRVLMVAPIRTGTDFLSMDNRGQTHLAVYRFDADGNEISAPLMLDPMPGIGSELGPSFIAPTRDGWLILASPFVESSGYYVVRLAPDGSLISGPDLVKTGGEVFFVDMIPYGGGAVALAGGNFNDYFSFSKVLFFEADGSLRQEWSPGGTMGLGGLVAHKGRLFVTYTYTIDPHAKPVTNQVLIREFQCVP